MKNSSITTSPIGLAQDFIEIFNDILNSDTSSDNWFQQYQVFRSVCKIHLDEVDSYLSSSMDLSHNRRSTFSTKSDVISLSNEDFIREYKDVFYQAVIKSPINNGEDTDSTILFSELLRQNRISTLHILNELYINNIDNENICVKLLSLCNDYSYEDLDPTAQTIAALSIHHKSNRVKSAAMNLFSHWGTLESYKLLCTIECPEEPWIVMKYQTIKKALEKKWCTQER